MKKTLLLAGVACLFAASAANAKMNYSDFSPYIGIDYGYDHASYKGDVKGAKKSYNSGIINVGARMYKYSGIEAFFQQSGKRKSFKGTAREVRTEFYAYGADLYGYLPVTCYGINLLGSAGLANYNVKAKTKAGGSEDKQRMGYRIGAGVQYDFNQHFAARVMGRYNYIGAKHLDNMKEITVGLRYSF